MNISSTQLFSLNGNFQKVLLDSFNLIMGSTESLVLTQSCIQDLFFLFFPTGAVTIFGPETTGLVRIVTRLSYLAARPSLESRPLQVFIHSFCLPDPPSPETGPWETKHFIGKAPEKTSLSARSSKTLQNSLTRRQLLFTKQHILCRLKQSCSVPIQTFVFDAS